MQESSKIRELELRLENLKHAKLAHKDLQVERNRITAQLSRDRKKVELDYLKAKCIEQSRQLQQFQTLLDTN